MKRVFLLLAVMLLFGGGYSLNAQGCSDAGFCTMNAFSDSDSQKRFKNQFSLGLSAGQADNDVSVLTGYISYKRELNSKLSIDFKLTYNSLSDGDYSASALSDLFISGSVVLSDSLAFTLGAKVPFTDGNTMDDGMLLPMDLQPGLGTFDLIAGLTWSQNNLVIAFAVQQPLNRNKNDFLASEVPDGSKFASYFSAREYKRKGDVMLRGSYRISVGEHLKLKPGLLAIYHLDDDEYKDVSGVDRAIDGSAGLTLNGTLHVDYQMNQKNTLSLSVGAPFITRDSRPDGLTRNFVATLIYRISF